MKINQNIPRLLGAAFLFVAVASALSGFLLGVFDIPTVGSPENLPATMMGIADSPTTMQLAIVVMFIEAAAIVLLADLLFTTLNHQNRTAARWAFGLWIIEAVALVIRAISAFALLRVSQEFAAAGTADTGYFQTLGGLLIGTIQFSYTALMVFYCIGGLLFYTLFFQSRAVPRALALFGMAAAALALVGTLAEILGLGVPLIVFLPILPFELGIGIWLLVKGINTVGVVSD